MAINMKLVSKPCIIFYTVNSHQDKHFNEHLVAMIIEHQDQFFLELYDDIHSFKSSGLASQYKGKITKIPENDPEFDRMVSLYAKSKNYGKHIIRQDHLEKYFV